MHAGLAHNMRERRAGGVKSMKRIAFWVVLSLIGLAVAVTGLALIISNAVRYYDSERLSSVSTLHDQLGVMLQTQPSFAGVASTHIGAIRTLLQKIPPSVPLNPTQSLEGAYPFIQQFPIAMLDITGAGGYYLSTMFCELMNTENNGDCLRAFMSLGESGIVTTSLRENGLVTTGLAPILMPTVTCPQTPTCPYVSIGVYAITRSRFYMIIIPSVPYDSIADSVTDWCSETGGVVGCLNGMVMCTTDGGTSYTNYALPYLWGAPGWGVQYECSY